MVGSISETMQKLSASERASYTQAYTNTPTTLVTGAVVTSIVRDNVVDSNTGVQYNLSDKLEAGVGFDYTQTTYVGGNAANYQDTDNYVVSASTYYAYSQAISVGLNYVFTESDPRTENATPAQSRQNNYGGVSLKFNQWQKVTGTVGFGVTNNNEKAAGAANPAVNTTTIAVSYTHLDVYKRQVSG